MPHLKSLAWFWSLTLLLAVGCTIRGTSSGTVSGDNPFSDAEKSSGGLVNAPNAGGDGEIIPGSEDLVSRVVPVGCAEGTTSVLDFDDDAAFTILDAQLSIGLLNNTPAGKLLASYMLPTTARRRTGEEIRAGIEGFRSLWENPDGNATIGDDNDRKLVSRYLALFVIGRPVDGPELLADLTVSGTRTNAASIAGFLDIARTTCRARLNLVQPSGRPTRIDSLSFADLKAQRSPGFTSCETPTIFSDQSCDSLCSARNFSGGYLESCTTSSLSAACACVGRNHLSSLPRSQAGTLTQIKRFAPGLPDYCASLRQDPTSHTLLKNACHGWCDTVRASDSGFPVACDSNNRVQCVCSDSAASVSNLLRTSVRAFGTGSGQPLTCALLATKPAVQTVSCSNYCRARAADEGGPFTSGTMTGCGAPGLPSEIAECLCLY